MGAPSQEETAGVESEVPPAVTCATCRLADCLGCPPPAPDAPLGEGVAWECSAGSFHERLWLTALATSTRPAHVFGALPEGRLVPAFAFALLAEGVAIGSLVVTAALAAWLAAPEWTRLMFGNATAAWLAVTLLAVASVAMVTFHALWGLCLEVGARTRERAAHYRQGLRFGLYACGWDLLTSPAGVVQGIAARGLFRAWGPILSAARVPSVAMRAYLSTCRGIDGAAQRRGMRLSLFVLGTAMLALTVPFVLWAFWTLRSSGW
ncbi:MAG TPA: hypothetical protein VF989_09940 [Polyangiaceae bacterium]|jgi:hypothetical protein